MNLFERPLEVFLAAEPLVLAAILAAILSIVQYY